MRTEKPPVLRRVCQWCSSGKLAIQYRGELREYHSERTFTTHYDKPGVCLVCPRCDSPSAAVLPQ